MTNVILAIRSALFYLGFAVFNVIFGFLSCLLGLIIPQKLLHNIITFGNVLCIVWLRITCGIKVDLQGKENLSKTAAVYLSNHESTWETFYLQRLLRPVSTIVKKELLTIPFFGWGLYFLKPIAINRANAKEALRKVLAGGVARIVSGNNVLIYPQGSRHSHKARANYARSGAAIAIEANVPVIPIVHNASHCWPNNSLIKKPGTITVIIGKPLSVTGKDSRELTQAVQNWVELNRSQMC